jgi:hypothetical protein
VNGGALIVDGRNSLSSLTTVNSGALGGSGTVGDTIINSGGMLAPGQAAGWRSKTYDIGHPKNAAPRTT